MSPIQKRAETRSGCTQPWGKDQRGAGRLFLPSTVRAGLSPISHRAGACPGATGLTPLCIRKLSWLKGNWQRVGRT